MHSIPYSTAQRLQQQILSGQYAKGELLPSQRDLSESMGISRASLREALSVLETLGLVDIVPGKGAVVRGVNSDADRSHRSFATPALGTMSPSQLIELRLVLEPGWTAMAAIRADARGLRQLQFLQAELAHALAGDDLLAGAEADLHFHMLLAELSGNHGLVAMARQLEQAIAHSLRLPFARTGSDDEPAREHEAIVQALLARDAAASAEAMRTHLLSAARRSGIDLSTPPPAGLHDKQSSHRIPPSQGTLK